MREQSQSEEIVNGITHGIGLLMAFVASVAMIAFVVQKGQMWYSISAVVYCFTMLMVYASSTVYHSISFPKVKHILRLMDHISIYLYIAGSYTAFVTILLQGETAFWNILMWSLAFLGVLAKIFFGISKFKMVSVSLYSIMGGMGLFLIPQLQANLPSLSFYLLIGGCFLYFIGGIIYGAGKFKYNHGVWHVFVIFATACHYASLMFGMEYL